MTRLVDAARVRLPPLKTDARKILVPVMAWNDSDVPWYSVMCGLLLTDAGHDVTFVIDDLEFSEHLRRQSLILACVRWVLLRLGNGYKVIALSSFAAAGTSDGPVPGRIRALAELNAVRDLRGEMVTDGRAAKVALFERQLLHASAAIKGLIASHPAEVVVLPGGVHATSGVWIEEARAVGTRPVTFDGGTNGMALWAMDGIACHFADVPRVFDRLLRESGDVKLELIVETASREIDLRRSGIDKFGTQMRVRSSGAGPDEDFVLIALNVPWDTQALDRHVCFKSICQFIVDTVHYVITSSDVHVVVRQHPAERMKATRSNDDYRSLLKETFGDHPQVHFVAPEDPVNTYDLMERSVATIVHTSTIGTEAVVFGKPTLTGADPYYASLGIVQVGRDPASYQDLLGKILRGELPVTEIQRHNALVLYYLSQCNGWISTSFNSGGFATWSRMPFAAIADAHSQRMLVDSIVNNVPICWQNHSRHMARDVIAEKSAA